MTEQTFARYPREKHGLYDPKQEKDSCGVGLIADLNRRPSHTTVDKAILILERLEHRGACCNELYGDGAGIMLKMPDDFVRTWVEEQGLELPLPGTYAVGNVFMPKYPEKAAQLQRKMEKIVEGFEYTVLCWRKVPTNDRVLYDVNLAPKIMQVVIVPTSEFEREDIFRTNIYIIRKLCQHQLQSEGFYICSLSSTLLVYKGQLTALQLRDYFLDLSSPEMKTTFALVHSRFATNTFPSWERAQPMRNMCHNGEINTLCGNINWMKAREGVIKTEVFGDHLQNLFPVLESDTSDSGSFDNVLEFLVASGRRIEEVIMMMIPEAWEQDKMMNPDLRAFYEFHSNLMEPWDGPAFVGFTDGDVAGAVLDRSGLRPGRFIISKDGIVLLSSEVGVIDIEPDNVLRKGRLQAGKMFLVDVKNGVFVEDSQIKGSIISTAPYRQWINDYQLKLDSLNISEPFTGTKENVLGQYKSEVPTLTLLKTFGYSVEMMEMLIGPMAKNGYEPLGSMGNDTPYACLSTKPRMLSEYFKQLFAQVSNPPIDPIRESIVMTLQCHIGPVGDICAEVIPEFCHRIELKSPVLGPEHFHSFVSVDVDGWKSVSIDAIYKKSEGPEGVEAAIRRVCEEVETAVREDGASIIILSHRNVNEELIQIPSHMILGAVHHYLVNNLLRSKTALIVEAGDVATVHEMSLLLGYGCDGIFPYVVYEAIAQDSKEPKQAIKNYRKAAEKGILKVMSKMGISTLQSYKAAQIFEALGIHQDVIDLCFCGTSSRISGSSFEDIQRDVMSFHDFAYPRRQVAKWFPTDNLRQSGEFHQRSGGELHLNSPNVISFLQQSTKANSKGSFKKFESISNDIIDRCTIRGLLDFDFDSCSAIDIDEVESAAEIVKRFATGAMSFGSISWEAHTTLAKAMNKIGGKSNSGEGGEDHARFTPLPNGESQSSAIKQVASGRFGVTSYYLSNAKEIQIKMAQGAKPGEGGELPGWKVNDHIARVRCSVPGVGLISPPPHHDIYSIEDLKQLIYDLHNANTSARVSVKLVAKVGIGVIAVGVAKAGAEHILVSGDGGGTGASRWTGIKHAGLPWELGLSETHQTLVMNNLRSEIVVQTDGGCRTGQDVVKAFLLGADEVGFATIPLIVMGCIMMRKCHLNTCPVGIATQDPVLRAKFDGQPEHVVNYFFMLAESIREIMAELGFRKVSDMVGQPQLLKQKKFDHPKLNKLDLSALIAEVEPQTNIVVDTNVIRVNLDSGLLDRVSKAIEYKDPVFVQVPISNQNRAVGAMLSHEITKKYGASGLPEDTIRIKFKGSAGESFGAFTCAGVTLELEGDANNYVGKGFSGGKMIIYPPKYSDFLPQENIIIGNVAFYGATSGKCFIRGMAAERFCVRNSGCKAVVEGVGDHACEYMTGGTVVILGAVGKNFGAGMSGGVCYVWDCKRTFKYLANDATYDIKPVETHHDCVILRSLIDEHVTLTGSTLGKKILLDFDNYVKRFFKIMPRDYQKYLDSQNKTHQIIHVRNWYQWSPRDVAQWLRQTNNGSFMKFSDRFINNKIGGPALLKMSPLAIRMMVGINSERICREIYYEIYQLRNQDQDVFIPKLSNMVCYFHFRSRKWLIGRVTDVNDQGYRVAFDTFDKWVRSVDVFPTAKMPRALSTNKMHEMSSRASLSSLKDFPSPQTIARSSSGTKFVDLHHVSPGLKAVAPSSRVLAAFDNEDNERRFRAKMRKRDPGRTTPSPSKDLGSAMKDIEDIIAPKTFHATIGGKLVEDRPTEIENPVKLRGFLKYSRKAHEYRPAKERMNDWAEVGEDHHDHKLLKTQGARCMDCGVPFCNDAKLGCPLGNRIPEFNDLVHKGDWKQALDRLLATNNFPEFTGRVCPAPCEGSCVLGLIDDPVTIKSIECAIIDKGFEEGWIQPCPPPVRTDNSISIIGSGPAGLAAADLLNKMGHKVTVYERDDRPGGLLMYGVPNMKLDKEIVVNRRLNLLEKEGIEFMCNADVGKDVEISDLLDSEDAVLLATGSTTPRDLPLPGRDLKGIMFAMDFLRPNTRSLLDSKHADGKFINAKDLKVIVVGGGDTGNDCIGTCMRHGCKSLVNFEMLPEKTAQRKVDNPWPLWPQIHRVDYGHEEVASRDGEDPRLFSLLSLEFAGNEEGHVTGVKTVRIRWSKAANGRWKNEHIEGTEKIYEADLILLACGFVGPELYTIGDLSVDLDRRKNYSAKFGENGHQTSVQKLFAAGDCRKGQSLVVHALAEGRHAAREIDRFLMGTSPLF